MAGRLVQFNAAPGETLAAGSEALVLEAMKMQHGIAAPGAGQVLQLCVAAGDFVAEGQLLMTLAPVDQADAAAADAQAHGPDHIRADLQRVRDRDALLQDAARPRGGGQAPCPGRPHRTREHRRPGRPRQLQ